MIHLGFMGNDNPLMGERGSSRAPTAGLGKTGCRHFFNEMWWSW